MAINSELSKQELGCFWTLVAAFFFGVALLFLHLSARNASILMIWGPPPEFLGHVLLLSGVLIARFCSCCAGHLCQPPKQAAERSRMDLGGILDCTLRPLAHTRLQGPAHGPLQVCTTMGLSWYTTNDSFAITWKCTALMFSRLPNPIGEAPVRRARLTAPRLSLRFHWPFLFRSHGLSPSDSLRQKKNKKIGDRNMLRSQLIFVFLTLRGRPIRPGGGPTQPPKFSMLTERHQNIA